MNNLAAFRKKLRAGQICVGIGIFLSAPAVSELIGEAGYDFTFSDMEHRPHRLARATNHLHALRGSDTAALIRVPAPDPVLMKPILDLYPAGIMIPQVRSAKEARAAVRGALYPPRGERGFGPMRGIRYGAVDGKAAGKYLGTATGGSEETVRRWVGRGVDFISTEDDFVNLYSSSLDLLNNVRRFATQ
jgi:2-keto-3-deoxy-L-rhamnonate aldolase RhmA